MTSKTSVKAEDVQARKAEQEARKKRRWGWAIAIIIVIGVFANAGGEPAPEPVMERQEAPAPAPKPEPVEIEPAPEPEPADDEFEIDDEVLAELAINMAWDQMPASDQADACFGWDVAPDMMADVFMGGAAGSGIPDDVMRDALEQHMREVCP